ncbi:MULTISPECIES: winged helix-turn-helix transcriptional regulator [unclassified Paracoccus (in: a-proteobacteria)]|uniref:winged helix-turn-helix transcriptional regulator n=1 Tax=unclassified Paracoccus (in: a-proteobacteria) TaxID=2688777 RepID=UPI0012B41923|nr:MULTISPECIES: winged helix-turn-helix transcriptional regulator [unclassified Paracoccus (in: a-proteobacteria)]UXU75610.1 winged helix-turn-helix transcriptional regulator [Paracoccus sp. SMMA_5]UXU81514.1 winged helix-turn-helix transcriptional regulator [Paracoccus sp. SMMA_5_TC]
MKHIGQNPRLRYDEGCLGAHALNLVGDRWALLVARELMFQPKRFQMLRAGLPGVTASVLSQRLAQMIAAGVVQHAPEPGLYALTPAGRALHPVLRELCRWALLMPGHDPQRFISISALMISISATVDAGRAAGSPLRGGFVSGPEGFVVTLDAAGAPLVRADPAPRADFVLTGSGNALAAAIYGPGPAVLAQSGRIALHGDSAAAQDFAALFSLRPQSRDRSASPDETEQLPGDSSTSSSVTTPSSASSA